MRDPHQIEPRVRLSPSVFASPPVIDGFSLAFCECSPFYFVVSVFLVLPFYSIHRPYASYFVSNSTGCGFFHHEKASRMKKKEERKGERERRQRGSLQHPGRIERRRARFANIFRKRDSTSGLGTVQSVNRTAIKLSSFHRNHGWTKTAGPSSENTE